MDNGSGIRRHHYVYSTYQRSSNVPSKFGPTPHRLGYHLIEPQKTFQQMANLLQNPTTLKLNLVAIPRTAIIHATSAAFQLVVEFHAMQPRTSQPSWDTNHSRIASLVERITLTLKITQDLAVWSVPNGNTYACPLRLLSAVTLAVQATVHPMMHFVADV